MTSPREIARWLAEDQLEGRRRSVTVGPDQVAVVIRNGAYGEPQSETRVETRGRFGGRSGQVEVLVASLAPFTVEYELDEIAGAVGVLGSGIPIVTRDGKAVSGNVRLTLAVDPGRPDLLSQLRHDRATITDGDVADALRDEFLTQVIRTTVAEIESSELRGTSDQFRGFYQETQTQLESQLANYGLSLRNFAIHVLSSDVAAEAERQQIERRRQLEQASQEFGASRRQVAPSRPPASLPPVSPRPPSPPPTTVIPAQNGSFGGGQSKLRLAIGIAAITVVVIVVLLSAGSGDKDAGTSPIVGARPTADFESLRPSPSPLPTATTSPRATAAVTENGATATPTADLSSSESNPVPTNNQPTVPPGSAPPVTPTETPVPAPTPTPEPIPQFSIAAEDPDFDRSLMRIFEENLQVGAKLTDSGELAVLYPDGSSKVFDGHISSAIPDGELFLIDDGLEFFAYTSKADDGCFLHLWIESKQTSHCIPIGSQMIDGEVSIPVVIEDVDHIFKINQNHFGLHVRLKIRENLLFKSGEGQLSFVHPETIVVYDIDSENFSFPLRGYAFAADGTPISNPSPKNDPLVLMNDATQQGIRTYRISEDRRSVWVFHPSGSGRSVNDWVKYGLFDGVQYAAYVPAERKGRTADGAVTDAPEFFIGTPLLYTSTEHRMVFSDGATNFFALDALDSPTVTSCGFSAGPLKIVIDFCPFIGTRNNVATIEPVAASRDSRYWVFRLSGLIIPSLLGVVRETCSAIPTDFDDQWTCLSLFGAGSSQFAGTTSAPYQAYGKVITPSRSTIDLIIDSLTGETLALTYWSIGWDGNPVILPDDDLLQSPVFSEDGCTLSNWGGAAGSVHQQVLLSQSLAAGGKASVVNPLKPDCWGTTSNSTAELSASEPSVLQLDWRRATGVLIEESVDGSTVTLQASLLGVDDSTVTAEIFEVDPAAPDELVATLAMSVVGGVGTAKWQAIWMPDGLFRLGGNPEYKFVVLGVDSGELVVVPAPTPLLPRLAGLPPGTIVTIAGIGEQGFSGDGGPASDALLSSPMGISIDGQGNIFIADTNNSRVRRIDAVTGVITTVAGTGPNSGKVDGHPANEALVHVPIDVAVDPNEDLYIAEPQQQRIRSVDFATGLISTIIASLPGQPNGVAIDCVGDVYVAMGSAGYIMRVSPLTGATSIVAGIPGDGGLSEDGDLATRAKLNFVTDVTVDCEGNIFIADAGNQRVFKVDGSTRILTTVAGGDSSGFGGDGGSAILASLFSPSGVAVDGQGNLFIADLNNHRIRRVDAATGVITTVAGNGIAGYAGDEGTATLAQLNSPTRIAIDGEGNLYISDTGNNRIRVVTAVAALAK